MLKNHAYIGQGSSKQLKKTSTQSNLKRKGNLYCQIYDIDNLILADHNASKGKANQPGVIRHKINREKNIVALHHVLKNKQYVTSEYSTFKIYEPKEREIYRLPYFPDRIVHHAIMQVISPILLATFTADTYSCIKGRGIHKAYLDARDAVRDIDNSKYCLKLDVRKFFPNIDHSILKKLLRRKFKDNDLLDLLDEIIDSTEGLAYRKLS